MGAMRLLLSLCVFFLLSNLTLAQKTDTTGRKMIIVEKAETFYYKKINGIEYQWMVGKVRMRQGQVYMSCDSALLLDNQMKAYGRVLIQQTDTINVFSDSLWYNGDTKDADLFGDVVLVNGKQEIFTKKLNYNLETKIAKYDNNAILNDGKTKLTSKIGYYFVNEKKAFFKSNVKIVDSTFNLKADTLEFLTDKRVAIFHGPTLIVQDTAKIYCEAGFYDILNRKAEFIHNAQYEGKDTKATADTIRYDGGVSEVSLIGNAKYATTKEIASAKKIVHNEQTKLTSLFGNAKYVKDKQKLAGEEIHYNGNDGSFKTKGRSIVSDPPQIMEADFMDYSKAKGYGTASGKVIWQDTSAKLIVKCDTTIFDRSKDYLKAFGTRPLLISYDGRDTTFLTADTLTAFRQIRVLDSSRVFNAYHDVRILRKDLQGICDSLSYNTADSVLIFYKVPILWSDTSQFIADTIHVLMANKSIAKVLLRKNSLIINSPDQIFFNQIKGRDITARFKLKKVNDMYVEGNSEAIYYALDDLKAYIGVNKAISSTMTLLFEDSKVKDIYFVTDPESSFIPMKKANHEALKLPGFKWDLSKRPRTLNDLFKEKTRIQKL
jgi:lipopolysaccharide export system protein LptA